MAPNNRPPPSLNLVSISSPARPISTSPSPSYRQSQSPFRYVKESQTMLEHLPQTPVSLSADTRRSIAGPSHHQSAADHSVTAASLPHARQPSPFLRGPSPLLLSSQHRLMGQSQTYTRPRGLRISNLIKPWIPLILYAATSIGFLIAIAFWKDEVFAGLDELALWLREDEIFGYATLFFLIFLTTFPPIPLYSTLIILSGYTFGPWTGAVISYCAGLSGALAVFILSRTFLRDCISRWLSCTISIKRVVRAIEKRPKLLFLIRLAPYPYNVMNCLLAASPTLTLRTYTVCTALSLFKVIIHTSLGASIHSFRKYHSPSDQINNEADDGANTIARLWTVIGIALCVAILVYLSVVARRAVEDELDEEAGPMNSEEAVSFLSPRGIGRDLDADVDLSHSMSQPHLVSTRLPLSFDGHGNGSDQKVGFFRIGDEEASIGL